MTREEILSIGEYYAEHKISYKKRQEEFGRPFRNFYKAKQKYWRADEQDTQSDEMRPCFAIGYDTPENYRKRYHKGELPRKNTFETRVASPEPKFVRGRHEKSDNKEDK